MWGIVILYPSKALSSEYLEDNSSGANSEGEARDTLIGAMKEVISIANAEGVALSDKDIDYYLNITDSLDPNGYPSMRQDAIAKRKTEVDMFAGTVIEIAAKHGIDVPVNKRIYERVKEIEKDFV